MRELVDSWLWMWNYRKPIIAQTHNYCLSGGLDLIGTCDIVFAAEGTRFGHPAGRGMGIPPIMGMLPMKIGAAATKELLFTGDLVDAQTAKELGIIQHVVPAAELDERVMALCQRIAMQPLDGLTVHKHIDQPLDGAPGRADRRLRERGLRCHRPPEPGRLRVRAPVPRGRPAVRADLAGRTLCHRAGGGA